MKFWRKLVIFQKHSHLSELSFWMLCVLVVLLSLGQWARIEISTLVFYPHDLVIVSWLFIEKIKVLAELKSGVKEIKQNALLLMSSAWLLLGMAIATFMYHDLLPWLYLLRILSYILFLVSAKSLLGNSNQILRIFSTVVGTVMVVVGFTQYAILPDTRYLLQFGWDEHYYRLIGTLLDPNFTSLILIVTFWGVLSLKKHFGIKLAYLLSGILLVGTGLTFSRAGYLALLSSLLVFAFLYTKRAVEISKSILITTICCVMIVVIAVLLAPKPGGEGVDLLRTNSIYARFEASKEFLEVMQPWQWFVGAGFYTRPASIHSLASHARVPDNLIVLILFSAGVVGLGLLIKLLKSHSSQLIRLSPETLAILTAVFVHAQFNNSVLEPFVFLIVGLSLMAENQNKTKET